MSQSLHAPRFFIAIMFIIQRMRYGMIAPRNVSSTSPKSMFQWTVHGESWLAARQHFLATVCRTRPEE